MNKEELIAEIKEVIAPYTEDKEALENIHEDTDFIKDLKINSANLVDVVLDLEEKYGIEIDNDSMAKLLTVKAAMDVITSKLSSR